MKLKAVSGIMLTLLFVGMLTLAFIIQPIRVESTPINLLKNADFEEGIIGWHSTKELDPGDTVTYTVDSTTSQSGMYCIRGVETLTGNLGRLYQDVTEKLVVGWQYRIGGWIKTQDVVGYVVIGLDYVNAQGWTPSGDSYVMEIGYVTETQDWTYFESEWFTLKPMPSGVGNVALWFLFDFNAGSGTAWWDDVALLGNPKVTVADIDINPDTLNLRSRGRWITAYIELPEGYSVSDIDVSSIKLNDIISAESYPAEVGDYDKDGIPDLMVKFNRQDLIAILSVGEAILTITGEVDEILFEGSDTIRAINK